MSIRCQTWVYEHSEATGNERLILLAIADEADDDGANAYPGVERIARKARVNKRTTMRCIERLEEAGRLQIIRPVLSGRGHFNSYVVVMGGAGKGDTLAGGEKEPEPSNTRLNGDRRARKGAQPYLDGSRPIDPSRETSLRRRCSFPADFEITEGMRAWAAQNVPGVDVDWQTEQLADWSRGNGETKADWVSTWRKWMRTSYERQDRPRPGGPARPSGEPTLVLPSHAGADPPPPGETYEEFMDRIEPGWRERKATG